MIKGKTYNLCEVFDDGDEDKIGEDHDDEIFSFLMGSQKKAEDGINKIKSPVREVDEFKQFLQMFTEVKVHFGDKVNTLLLEKLSSSSRLVLPGVL